MGSVSSHLSSVSGKAQINCRKFLAKGYKVGRVDQAETALGAEMRVAANKGKGAVKEDKGKDKIVRRELNKVDLSLDDLSRRTCG